jgi:hypothetical protein
MYLAAYFLGSIPAYIGLPIGSSSEHWKACPADQLPLRQQRMGDRRVVGN